MSSLMTLVDHEVRDSLKEIVDLGQLGKYQWYSTVHNTNVVEHGTLVIPNGAADFLRNIISYDNKISM